VPVSGDPLARFVTEAALARLAGERSYARGRAYFESGAVLDPAEAAELYRARVEPIVHRAGNPACDEAAKLARRICGLMKRAGQEQECGEWVDALRVRHKAKRNLMQRLDRLG